jgi:hypothetical protein
MTRTRSTVVDSPDDGDDDDDDNDATRVVARRIGLSRRIGRPHRLGARAGFSPTARIAPATTTDVSTRLFRSPVSFRSFRFLSIPQ